MTTIGSLALRLYKDKYGHRPRKQLEQVGEFRFKTYHYDPEAVELIDSVIDLVMRDCLDCNQGILPDYWLGVEI